MSLKQCLALGITGISMGTAALQTNAIARSLPGYNSSHWYKTRTVHIRKAVYAYQINPRTWKTRSKKVLHVNTQIKIYNSANLSWVVSTASLHKTHGYTWVVKGHYNTSWLK